MAKRTFFKNSTGNIIDVFLQDASTSSGAGLINVTTAINAGYRAGPTGVFTTFALAAVSSADAAHSSGGGIFQHSSTKCPGLYRFDVPDAAMTATGAAIIFLSSGSGGANLAPCVIELEVKSTDGVDNPTDVRKFGGTAVTGRDIGASVLLSSGTGAGQVVLASGKVDVGAINGVSAAAVTAVKDIIGSSQQINFASTGSTASVKSDIQTINGAAPSTGTAHFGVNVVTLSSAANESIADKFLDRDMSTGVDSGSSAFRTPRQALRALRNKWAVSGGTYTVYKEDDATASWTGAVTTTATADPITGNDPA